MRFFIDAEFNGFGGDLISLAAVPEDADAEPFYEAVTCERPTAWVAEHVIPVLETPPRSLETVSALFQTYLASDPHPVLVADWPEDIGHAARLLTDGRGNRFGGGAVTFQLLAASDGAGASVSRKPHNAYYDACALRDWVLRSGK